MSVYKVRGHCVVIAGARVDVSPDAVALLADDQRNLGVHLQANQSVDHVHALAFQRSRPLDVAFLVEARLQFHHAGDLLVPFHRLQQRVNHRRIAAHAVQASS